MEMVEQIKTLLVKGIDSEALLQEIASHFYETIEEKKKHHRIVAERLAQYVTLKDYFEKDWDPLGLEDQEILQDMQDDIEYALEDEFDRVEDDVKHELLHGKLAALVKEDVKAKGFILSQQTGRRHLDENELEEIYLEAFTQFDFLRMHLSEYIQKQAPQEFYALGRQQIEAYRQEKGLLMDAKEFNDYYEDHFDKERLWDLFAHKIYECIHYNQHYILEEPEADADEEEEAVFSSGTMAENEEETAYQADDKDAILVPDGDLSPDMFSFVYELMDEYNGRRVLPSENEWGEEAYWTTYRDDFAEILGLFMIAQLENTIRYFNEECPEQYDTLAHLYHWSLEDRKNPEVVLTTCDKISYFLTDMQEALWNEFSESELLPLYERGKNMA